MSEEGTKVTGHVPLKRKRNTPAYKDVVASEVRGILADHCPDAEEIDVRFYTDGMPKIFGGRDFIFAMRNTFPVLVKQGLSATA